MKTPETFKITTVIDIPSERVADLFDKPTSYTDYPLNRGGFLMVGDIEKDMPDALLDLGTIRSGLQVMAYSYPRHWHDFINDNEDAATGDVFLQCCLYGEVIFG
jgi:hypothetical protein